MADDLVDLATARILITNDDGINAPGLKVLQRIARGLSKDVWTVAPETEQSATTHSLTLRRPLRSRKVGPRRFTVDGTPTDCVMIALHKLIPGKRPDLVLSGINYGANLGEDVTYSGTVAAAMEGALLGVRSIALSQVRVPGQKISFAVPESHGAEVVRGVLSRPWPRDLLVNVNFPPCAPDEITGIRACVQGRREAGIEVIEGTTPYGVPTLWIGDFLSHECARGNSDLGAIKDKAIAVTPLHLDLTHKTMVKRLREVFP